MPRRVVRSRASSLLLVSLATAFCACGCAAADDLAAHEITAAGIEATVGELDAVRAVNVTLIDPDPDPFESPDRSDPDPWQGRVTIILEREASSAAVLDAATRAAELTSDTRLGHGWSIEVTAPPEGGAVGYKCAFAAPALSDGERRLLAAQELALTAGVSMVTVADYSAIQVSAPSASDVIALLQGARLTGTVFDGHGFRVSASTSWPSAALVDVLAEFASSGATVNFNDRETPQILVHTDDAESAAISATGLADVQNVSNEIAFRVEGGGSRFDGLIGIEEE